MNTSDARWECPQLDRYQIWSQHSSCPEHSLKLEARIIEFLSEWLVTFLMPAKHVLDTRAPTFILCSLKNTGSVISWSQSHYILRPIGVIHTNYRWTGQMHHTRLQAQRPAGSMERQFITVFVPAWMIPPIYITACAGKALKIRTPPAQ